MELWASAKKLIWTGDGSPISFDFEIGAVGIRTICCRDQWIPSWILCSWHSLAKFYHPMIVLRKCRKASRGKALVKMSARWWVVAIFSTSTFLSSTCCRKWCNWTARCFVLGRSSWVFASSRAPTLSSKTRQVTFGDGVDGSLIPKSWISWMRLMKQITSLMDHGVRGCCG